MSRAIFNNVAGPDLIFIAILGLVIFAKRQPAFYSSYLFSRLRSRPGIPGEWVVLGFIMLFLAVAVLMWALEI